MSNIDNDKRLDNISENLEKRVKWIESNGKKILSIDCSNLLCNDTIKIMDIVLRYYEGQKDVLSITDYTGAYADEESFNTAKDVSFKVKDQLKKGAAIGITGIKKIFMSVINSFMGNRKFRQFNTYEEAIKWLTED